MSTHFVAWHWQCWSKWVPCVHWGHFTLPLRNGVSFLQAGLEWETDEKRERISTLGLSEYGWEKSSYCAVSLSLPLYRHTHSHRVFIFLLRHACTHWENSKGHIYYWWGNCPVWFVQQWALLKLLESFVFPLLVHWELCTAWVFNSLFTDRTELQYIGDNRNQFRQTLPHIWQHTLQLFNMKC